MTWWLSRRRPYAPFVTTLLFGAKFQRSESPRRPRESVMGGRGFLIRGLSFVVATLLAGCTVVPRETQVTVTPGVERPVIALIGNYQAAVNAIVSVMTEDLQIPLPKTSFTLYFYPYREAF